MTTNGDNKNSSIYLSDDSDDNLDLVTVQRQLGSNSNNDTQNAAGSVPTAGASSSGTGSKPDVKMTDDDDDEPDWVREFSAKQEENEDHKRALASLYDGDDDDNENGSIIDLLSDKEEDEIQKIEEKDTKRKTKSTTKASTKESNTKKTNVKSSTTNGSSTSTLKSCLPLVVASKLDESLVLLQGSDEELDLSGDVGAVGRVKISDGTLYIDMKGGVFKGETYPCNTMAVVSVMEDEARITAVMDEAVVLRCERNLFASDQVIKGDLSEFDDNQNGDDDSGVGGDEMPSQSASKNNRKGASSETTPRTKKTITGRGRGGGVGSARKTIGKATPSSSSKNKKK